MKILFISALRSLRKNKVVGLINIIGLAISLTAFIFIMHYVFYEESYDTFFKQSEQVFRVNMKIEGQGQTIQKSALTPRQLYFTARQEIPEIEANAITYFEACLVKNITHSFLAQNVLWADEGFEKVFPLKLEQGKAGFERPLTAIISAEKAKSFFGNENAIGKIIKVNEGMPVEITGVFADLPSNTHLQADYFISLKTFVHYGWIKATGDWYWPNWWNYLRLKQGASVEAVEKKLNALAARHMQFLNEKKQTAQFSLQPLRDLHYVSGITGEFGAATNKSSLINLLIIGTFILFIAWINFVNLSSALAEKNRYDLGVKKILGATKWHLWMQSLLECLITNMLALALSFTAYRLLLHPFAHFFSLPLSKAYIPAGKIAQFIMIAFITGIVFSSLSGTANIIRSDSWNLKNRTIARTGFRKGLVIVQLVISIVFIGGTMLVFKQIRFMQQHNLGMKIDQVITANAPASLNTSNLIKKEKYASFRNELLSNPKFLAGTALLNIPGQAPLWKGEEFIISDSVLSPETQFYINVADEGFIKTYNLTLLAGKNFSAIPEHNKERVIINEQAAKSFGFSNATEAVGKFYYNKNRSERKEIIGVIKDFHNEGLQKPIYPQIWINGHPAEFGYYSFRIHGTNLQNTMQVFERTWKKYYPDDPFDYFFANDFYNRQYISELRFGKFYLIVAVLSISISCLGLYGLLLFFLEQKQKEIAIRRISGAYISQLVVFINKSFIRWNLVAFAIACPLVYLLMYKWLQNFAYKTDISWWIFVGAGGITIIISLLTVSWQSYKAATQKPTEAIKQK